MTNLLLIADQTRLHEIFDKASALPGVKIRVSTVLNQGLQEIAADAPSILFIQSRLSGLSGEIITRHVKSELKDGKTKIILFSDVANEGGAGEIPADTVLDLAATDKELADRIQEIIVGLGEADKGPAVTNNDVVQGGAPAVPLVETVIDSVSIGKEKTTTSTFQEELDCLIGKSKSPQALPNAHEQEVIPESSDHDSAAKEMFSFDSGQPSKMVQRERKWLFPAISLLAMAAVAGIFLFSSRGQKPATEKKSVISQPSAVKALPAATKAPVKPTTPPPPQLPAFIPREGMDSRYGETHPGWERYVSATAEFKVYREKSAIKALQVIDRNGDGIKPQFFTKVVQEMTGVRDYTMEAKEQKGDYLIKKGKLTAKSRVILYKKKSDTVLQAFVIYFE